MLDISFCCTAASLDGGPAARWLGPATSPLQVPFAAEIASPCVPSRFRFHETLVLDFRNGSSAESPPQEILALAIDVNSRACREEDL